MAVVKSSNVIVVGQADSPVQVESRPVDVREVLIVAGSLEAARVRLYNGADATVPKLFEFGDVPAGTTDGSVVDIRFTEGIYVDLAGEGATVQIYKRIA